MKRGMWLSYCCVVMVSVVGVHSTLTWQILLLIAALRRTLSEQVRLELDGILLDVDSSPHACGTTSDSSATESEFWGVKLPYRAPPSAPATKRKEKPKQVGHGGRCPFDRLEGAVTFRANSLDDPIRQPLSCCSCGNAFLAIPFLS